MHRELEVCNIAISLQVDTIPYTYWNCCPKKWMSPWTLDLPTAFPYGISLQASSLQMYEFPYVKQVHEMHSGKSSFSTWLASSQSARVAHLHRMYFSLVFRHVTKDKPSFFCLHCRVGETSAETGRVCSRTKKRLNRGSGWWYIISSAPSSFWSSKSGSGEKNATRLRLRRSNLTRNKLSNSDTSTCGVCLGPTMYQRFARIFWAQIAVGL